MVVFLVASFEYWLVRDSEGQCSLSVDKHLDGNLCSISPFPILPCFSENMKAPRQLESPGLLNMAALHTGG